LFICYWYSYVAYESRAVLLTATYNFALSAARSELPQNSRNSGIKWEQTFADGSARNSVPIKAQIADRSEAEGEGIQEMEKMGEHDKH